MKLLFDANVPRGLGRLLEGHEFSTAQEQGWAAARNGDLLRLAEAAGFDVFITADQNIGYQQNLRERTIALVVLWTNDWSLLRAAVPQIAGALGAATPKGFQTIGPGKVVRQTPRD